MLICTTADGLLEAYAALARKKRPGQSFSQVIRQHFGTLKTGRDLRSALRGARLSDETPCAIPVAIGDSRRGCGCCCHGVRLLIHGAGCGVLREL